MLVCHCHALTDRDIRRAIRTAGACSVAEVGDQCGATTGCGGCYEVVDQIVACEKRRLAMYSTSEAQDTSKPGVEQATVQPALALTG